jgi:hypothetical protein
LVYGIHQNVLDKALYFHENFLILVFSDKILKNNRSVCNMAYFGRFLLFIPTQFFFQFTFQTNSSYYAILWEIKDDLASMTSEHSIYIRTRVSVQGVESLWGDCRFIPADWGS